MLAGAGVALVGAAAGFAGYAAFGPSSGTTPAPPASGGGGTDADTGGQAGGTELAKLSDVPENGGVVLGSEEIVLCRGAGSDIKAFSAICTHQGCVVAEVSGGTINCGCHGSQFSTTTGDVVAGPARKPLPAIAVTVSGDSIRKGG